MKDQIIWTVSLRDMEDDTMGTWTSVFSSEELADEYERNVLKMLERYDIQDRFEITRDYSMLDDDVDLIHIMENYGARIRKGT